MWFPALPVSLLAEFCRLGPVATCQWADFCGLGPVASWLIFVVRGLLLVACCPLADFCGLGPLPVANWLISLVWGCWMLLVGLFLWFGACCVASWPIFVVWAYCLLPVVFCLIFVV